MFIGTILFMVVIVMIAPHSRQFVMDSVASAGNFIDAWAPFSYVLMLLLVAATFGFMYVLKSWPQTEEPENPMAKYRREEPVDD
jgi:hypothetical protein